MCTTRSQRIDEYLRGMIERGEKISVQDIQNLQQDVLDVNARYNKPIIIEISRQVKELFSA